MTLLTDLEDAGRELAYAAPGGFLAYWIHSIHHRLFHALTRLVPRRLRGGTHG